MNSYLWAITLSGSRAPWKETLATKQLKGAKDSVSYHCWIKQGTSDKNTAPNYIACLLFQNENETPVLFQAHIFHPLKVLKKKKFKGLSMKILNVTVTTTESKPAAEKQWWLVGYVCKYVCTVFPRK